MNSLCVLHSAAVKCRTHERKRKKNNQKNRNKSTHAKGSREKNREIPRQTSKRIVLSGIFDDNKLNFANIFHTFGNDNLKSTESRLYDDTQKTANTIFGKRTL